MAQMTAELQQQKGELRYVFPQIPFFLNAVPVFHLCHRAFHL
jgi:hypothetical protein